MATETWLGRSSGKVGPKMNPGLVPFHQRKIGSALCNINDDFNNGAWESQPQGYLYLL